MEPRLLARRGTLWTFTVQGFRPKEPYTGPDEFEPYGVGYVELADGVMVESRLTENDPARLKIGDEMELSIVPFRRDANGNDVVTFMFGPIATPAGSGRGRGAGDDRHRRRHRRHRHPPVRPSRRRVRPRAGRLRRAPGAGRRGHRLGRRAVRLRRQQRTAGTPTRSSASSASPACRSSTWPTGARPAASALISADSAIRSGAVRRGHGHRVRQARPRRVQRRSRGHGHRPAGTARPASCSRPSSSA